MASLPAEDKKSDNHSLSREKSQEICIERSESLDGLPDPDAGKSDEERKKIVWFPVAVSLDPWY